MRHADPRKSDIPVPIAIAFLAAFFAFIAAGGDSSSAVRSINQMNDFISQYPNWIGASTAAMLINLLCVSFVLARTFSYRRQGARLRELASGKRQHIKPLLKKAMATIFLCAAFTFGFMVAEHIFGTLLPSEVSDPLSYVVIGNLSLATAILLQACWHLCRHCKSPRSSKTNLDVMPSGVNSLALGTNSINGQTEEWCSIKQKGLNGNILVTGSIGSGKTQGTVLPYFDQFLANFHPSPAVTAIDPKGTFIAEALKIAEAHGLGDKVLHVKLGGDVTFNPIYEPDVLRRGRFLDVAQMLRAAAINFSGRSSSDSPFWELSAFNLTKNALIYVAAVHGYYTLSDLYLAMLAAVEDQIVGKLEEALRTKSFAPEETHNIRHAMAYFALEFQNFDLKVKTGIIATATSFLNQFQEFQAGQIFCPPENERTILSMDDVVDSGKLLFFDIASPGLARAMGTFIKLQYQQSILRRLTDTKRNKERSALLIIDEYQDVVSSGYGTLMGDDRFLAKAREANAVTIAATQSLSSLENSLGRDTAAKELCQNFRTRIACHSTDLLTIRTFQELIGEEDREKRSHSYSELSQDARKNFLIGGFEADNANISESVSTSLHREPIITGKDFSRLRAFESLALVFDGLKTHFVRLNLKPYFLKRRHVSHSELMASLASILVLMVSPLALGFPNVCDVVKQRAFSSCLEYRTSGCTCPGIPPRPCTRFTYYVPETYIEVTSEPRSTKFQGLPGAAAQLSGLSGSRLPYGTEGNDFIAYQARTVTVPYTSIVTHALPCSGHMNEATCFGAMSEHLGSNWSTGLGDLRQPSFLLWSHDVKGCLLAGATRSAIGGDDVFHPGGPTCSIPLEGLTQYPPSPHSACTGWGVFYPRVGIYDGPSQTTGALMVASRMKSLSGELFQSAGSSPDEKWQMILPSSSQCFREGQNVGLLETAALVNDGGRLAGHPKDYLFVVWKRMSCCKDMFHAPIASAVLAGLRSSCQGLGGIP